MREENWVVLALALIGTMALWASVAAKSPRADRLLTLTAIFFWVAAGAGYIGLWVNELSK